MSNRYRAAGGDLLFKYRNDTAVASQDIPEAHCDKARFALLLKCAYYQFRDAFGSTHHARRANRLVGRDHDKVFHAMVNRGAGYIPGSENVIFYCRKYMSFHHGHVFVCGGVVDDRRLIAFHRLLYIRGARDIAQLGEKRQAGKLVVQLSV